MSVDRRSVAAAIVLAAGRSGRFRQPEDVAPVPPPGRPPSSAHQRCGGGEARAAGADRADPDTKVVACVGGRPMVRRAVEAAIGAGLTPVCVVLGPGAKPVRRALSGLPCVLVENPRPDLGIGSSLAAGARACPATSAALIVLLADQPFVSAALVARLLEVWRAERGAIVRPVFRGTPGHPVVFDNRFLVQLRRLEGGAAGRDVVASHADAVRLVPVDDPLLLADVDTPTDLRRVRRLASE